MKSLKRNAIETTKYLLTNLNGVEVFLIVPNTSAKEQKYFLDYKTDVRHKYYAKGEIKRKAIEFFKSIQNEKCTKPQIEASLSDILKNEIAIVQSEINSIHEPREVKLTSRVTSALKSFFSYKELQRTEGTVSRNSLYGYKHHHRKLMLYFELPLHRNMMLADLTSTKWQSYRIDLLNNTHKFGKKSLKNSSVNQHFLYIHQFYIWLIEFHDLPIRNHLNKLNKLNEAQQGKRFDVIPADLMTQFYHILETYEKYYFTRLYLSALFLYENNIRLSEQVLIKVKDVDLDKGLIVIINNKNDSRRVVAISDKAIELIIIIKQNTIRRGIVITDDMYIIGGHDMFKSGIPHTQKELGVVMRRFRKKYPQFKEITLYEFKHTSITNQFNTGVDTYKIKERANHGSITTTEIYLKGNRIVEPYLLNEN